MLRQILKALAGQLWIAVSFLQEGGSRAPEPGSFGLPTTERYGGPQHAEDAENDEVSEIMAPPDPRGMVKARLLKVQSRSGLMKPRHSGMEPVS